MSNVIIVQPSGPGWLVRVIWFIFLGWWLGGIVSVLAWALCLTILGLPLGVYLIKRLPGVITLRPQGQDYRLNESGQLVKGNAQRPFLWRALYYLLVGWWLSLLWLALAYACLVTILLLPLAFWMYGRIGAVITLHRS